MSTSVKNQLSNLQNMLKRDRINVILYIKIGRKRKNILDLIPIGVFAERSAERKKYDEK